MKFLESDLVRFERYLLEKNLLPIKFISTILDVFFIYVKNKIYLFVELSQLKGKLYLRLD